MSFETSGVRVLKLVFYELIIGRAPYCFWFPGIFWSGYVAYLETWTRGEKGCQEVSVPVNCTGSVRGLRLMCRRLGIL